MKITNHSIQTFPKFLYLIALSFPLLAEKPVDVAWQDVCQVAGTRELTFTIPQGGAVDGRCVRATSTEIVVNTGHHRLLTLERRKFSTIFVQPRNHRLKSLWKDVNSAMRFEVETMLSEAGPLALAGVPTTFAWGVAATPFCAIGDLVGMIKGAWHIRVI
jgi:hypothetical protein